MVSAELFLPISCLCCLPGKKCQASSSDASLSAMMENSIFTTLRAHVPHKQLESWLVPAKSWGLLWWTNLGPVVEPMWYGHWFSLGIYMGGVKTPKIWLTERTWEVCSLIGCYCWKEGGGSGETSSVNIHCAIMYVQKQPEVISGGSICKFARQLILRHPNILSFLASTHRKVLELLVFGISN